jgi:ATP-dependent protease ClpP protease subunit
MIVQNKTITATMNYLKKRSPKAPAEHFEFWEHRLACYSALPTLSEMERIMVWQGCKPPERKKDWKDKPLAHLPTVSVGYTDPAAIWRFKIHGEMCFRDQPEELAARAKGASEIHLDIETPGGDGRWALAFGACLRSTGARIVATARRAYSAGALLLQCAHVRRIEADGSIMVHGPQTAIWGGVDELEAEARMMRQDRAKYAKLYRHRTGQKKPVITSWLSKDTYFNAEQALAVGLVDEIVPAEVKA